MNKQPLPVKVSILRVIHKALLPIKVRLDALLEDFYSKRILLSQAELTTVLEFRSASATAELMLDDYLSKQTRLRQKVYIFHQLSSTCCWTSQKQLNWPRERHWLIQGFGGIDESVHRHRSRLFWTDPGMVSVERTIPVRMVVR